MTRTNEAIVKDAAFMVSETRARANDLLSARRFDEARQVLRDWVASLPAEDVNERAASLVLLGVVERRARNLFESRRVLLDAYPLAELSCHAVRAKFHNALAVTYKQIATEAKLPDYFDNALIEYEAARFHFEEAGDAEGAGYVENNVALCCAELGDAAAARVHLERARGYFAGQSVRLAELDDTEAQVCLAEGDREKALFFAIEACRAFLALGEEKHLADALPTLIKAAAEYTAGG